MPASGDSTRRSPPSELERTVRALSPHIGAYLSSKGRSGSACSQPRAEPGELAAGELEGGDSQGLRLGCATGALELLRSGRRAGARWRRAPTCAAIPSRGSRERAAALGIVRVCGRHGRHSGAAGGVRGRAPDLRAGGVDRPRVRRRGRAARSSTSASWRSHGGSPTGRCSGAAPATSSSRGSRGDRSRGSTRRRWPRFDSALYELLFFSDAPAEHAAVDQAVELAKAGRAALGRGPPPGFVNAVLRRIAGEREAILAGLDDSTAEGAAIAHSYPPWMAAMWWEELGAAEARLLMASMNEPSETALRVNTLIAEPAGVAAELRAAGLEVREGGAGGPLEPAEALVVSRASDEVGARVATGELVPQSRGSQAIVELLDPRPGERVLDLCAGPGIKTTAIGARMRASGELVAIESDGTARRPDHRALRAHAGELCQGRRRRRGGD